MLSPNSPVYIGISGLPGSGKTTVANTLAPYLRFLVPTDNKFRNPSPVWSHYTLSAPLYEMAGILRQTEGDNRLSRIHYGLYDILNPLLERKLPFDQLVELVEWVGSWDAGTADDAKPRKMLQEVGDMCREVYLNCFVNAVIRKVELETRIINAEHEAEIPDTYTGEVNFPTHYAILSDVRYQNEADALRDQNNSFLIKLNVSFETARERVLDRDGVVMAQEQWNHPAEAGLPDHIFDLIVDTEAEDAMGVTRQIRKFILEQTKTETTQLEAAING